jgi:hypothetical protein
MSKLSQNDRISYSFGMKLSLPAKYESADFHISMTSDVNEGEGESRAMNRIKNFVHAEVTKAYEAIRQSETGLLNEPLTTKSTPSTDAPAITEKPKNKPTDPKILRQQIKLAFGVLEAKKQTTKDTFKSSFLNNKKVDELTENETLFAIIKLRETFPELNL